LEHRSRFAEYATISVSPRAARRARGDPARKVLTDLEIPPRTFRLESDLLAALQAVKERDGISIPEQIRRAVHVWLETVGMPLQRTQVTPRLMSEERRAQMHAAYVGLLHELAEAEAAGCTHQVQIPSVFRRLGGRPLGSLSEGEMNEFITLITQSLHQRTDDFERIYKSMRRRKNRPRQPRQAQTTTP
jgi:hypothetical protein